MVIYYLPGKIQYQAERGLNYYFTSMENSASTNGFISRSYAIITMANVKYDMNVTAELDLSDDKSDTEWHGVTRFP